MSNQENDVRRDEFGSRLRAPSFVNTVGAIKLEKEIELPSSIYAFHADLAREFDYRTFAEYLEGLMKH